MELVTIFVQKYCTGNTFHKYRTTLFVLHRAGTPPFSRARDVLLSPNPTILELCHTVPLEVVCLKTGMNDSITA